MNRIAIIDDHVLLGQVLANDLTKHGLDATVVPLGPDLVERVRSANVDLVLLDLELGPDMPSGVDLIDPIQQTGTRVIVLSGVENPILLARCLELGVTGILPKKTAFDDLVSEITRSIESGDIAPSAARRLELFQLLAAHRRSSQEVLRPFEELSDREMEILLELMAGKSVSEISEISYGRRLDGSLAGEVRPSQARGDFTTASRCACPPRRLAVCDDGSGAATRVIAPRSAVIAALAVNGEPGRTRGRRSRDDDRRSSRSRCSVRGLLDPS